MASLGNRVSGRTGNRRGLLWTGVQPVTPTRFRVGTRSLTATTTARRGAGSSGGAVLLTPGPGSLDWVANRTVWAPTPGGRPEENSVATGRGPGWTGPPLRDPAQPPSGTPGWWRGRRGPRSAAPTGKGGAGVDSPHRN